MTKLVTFLLALTISAAAYATPDYSLCAKTLYPNNQDDQAFVAKFFEIVELHKKIDPLMEGRGPSIIEYSLDKMKFVFMVNDTENTVDLVFFNWNLSSFSGLQLQNDLTKAYGSNVYLLKGVSKKSVASQGDNHDQLTNFSYLHGARYMEAQLKIGNPEYQVPEQFLNWKPHPEYMDRSHPLRQALDTRVLVLLSPTKDLFLKQAGATEQTRPFFETMFQQKGGYYNMIMGMMVHEMFHVKEGEDNVNGLAKRREVPEDRKALVAQLKSDANLRSLFATYAKIAFSIGDSLKNSVVSSSEIEKLGELKVIMTEIKTKYPNAWSFIWDYEYTEGFAEYVSTYSMIQSGITSFSQQIDLQKSDENNFAYRTGTIGGLYLSYRVKQMPFDNNEDHSNSLWEIILAKTQVKSSETSVSGLVSKYSSYPFKSDEEIANVIDYLVSTVMEN